MSTHGVVDDAVGSTTRNRLGLKINHKLILKLKLILKNESITFKVRFKLVLKVHIMNDMLLLLLLSLRGLLRLLIDLLHVIVIVIATIDDGVFAESEFVARMQLLVAHKALEAAQMVDEMTRSHYELVRRYALCTAVTLSWKPPFCYIQI